MNNVYESDKQVQRTVEHMYRNIQLDKDSLPYFSGVVNAFDYIRSIPYVSDLASTGRDEFVKRASDTIQQGGDCDDKVVLSGIAFNQLGLPFRIVTASYDPSGIMQHTYTEVFFQNKWQPFDPTYPTNFIFSEKPYTRKILWDNSVMYKGLSGDTSSALSNIVNTAFDTALQTNGDKDKINAAVIHSAAAASLAIPVVGPIISGLVELAGMVGIRGASKHVDIEPSLQMWHDQITVPLEKFYWNLTPAGRAKLEELAKSFFENEIAHWGNYWDSFGKTEYARVKTLPEWSDPRWRTDWYLGFPFHALRIKTHAGSDDAFWLNAANNGIRGFVWNPFAEYLKTNPKAIGLNTSTSPTQPGTTPQNNGVQSAGMGTLPMLLIGGVALTVLGKMFLGSKNKRRSK